MPTPSLRPVLLGLTLLAAVLASAQADSERDRSQNDPRWVAIKGAIGRAGKLVTQSRQRLREGKLAQAEVLAQAAVREGDEINWKDPSALGMLAEVYLAEGEPGIAMSTLDEFKNGMESDRSLYLRAVCLIRTGDLDKARRVLVSVAGDGEALGSDQRSGIRNQGLPIPMDGDGSAAALESTAHLLLSETEPSDGPERLEDLRAAVRLAPNSCLAHYRLAKSLIQRDRFDEAAPEIDRAAKLGEPWVGKNLRDDLRRYQESYPRRHPARDGGPKAP